MDPDGVKIIAGPADGVDHLLFAGCFLIPEVFLCGSIPELCSISDQLRKFRMLFLKLLPDLNDPLKDQHDQDRDQDPQHFGHYLPCNFIPIDFHLITPKRANGDFPHWPAHSQNIPPVEIPIDGMPKFGEVPDSVALTRR